MVVEFILPFLFLLKTFRGFMAGIKKKVKVKGEKFTPKAKKPTVPFEALEPDEEGCIAIGFKPDELKLFIYIVNSGLLRIKGEPECEVEQAVDMHRVKALNWGQGLVHGLCKEYAKQYPSRRKPGVEDEDLEESVG